MNPRKKMILLNLKSDQRSCSSIHGEECAFGKTRLEVSKQPAVADSKVLPRNLGTRIPRRLLSEESGCYSLLSPATNLREVNIAKNIN